MRLRDQTKGRTKSQPNGRDTRERINITLKPNVRTMGETLADQDKREFSYELEWLIETEFTRRLGKVERKAA